MTATNAIGVSSASSASNSVTPAVAATVTTFAGTGSSGSANGTGIAASFNNPSNIVFDSSGNAYVADSGNYRIRKITPAGVVTTFAGSGYGSVNDTGTAASFTGVEGIGIDSTGMLYITEANNNIVRKISTPGAVVSSFVGAAGVSGTADGTGASATFSRPASLVVDSNDDIYLVDKIGNKVRKITLAGVVTTFAGSGSAGISDGTGATATFNGPAAITNGGSGKIVVVDGATVRDITVPGAVVTQIAGSPFGGVGNVDGTGLVSRFYNSEAISIDISGNLYVADTKNHSIRKITPAGVVTTIAGSLGGVTGNVNGSGADARFNNPTGIAVYDGVIYVVDKLNHSIRKIVIN